MEQRIRKAEERLRFLESVREKALASMEKAPRGKLRVSMLGSVTRFYRISREDDKNGVYIPKSEIAIARSLAQKEYAEKLIASIEKEERAIRRYIRILRSIRPEDVYGNLHPARQKLVTPLILDDEAYAKWWQSRQFPANPSHPEEQRFATKRGEYLRSKAEAMIADAYYEMGIPYICEYPIRINEKTTRYCDFYILDKRTRKAYYHEHFGMLDRPEYLKKNIRKLREYESVGIFTGENLILTCETADCPMDMNQFRTSMSRFLALGRKLDSSRDRL